MENSWKANGWKARGRWMEGWSEVGGRFMAGGWKVRGRWTAGVGERAHHLLGRGSEEAKGEGEHRRGEGHHERVAVPREQEAHETARRARLHEALRERARHRSGALPPSRRLALEPRRAEQRARGQAAVTKRARGGGAQRRATAALVEGGGLRRTICRQVRRGGGGGGGGDSGAGSPRLLRCGPWGSRGEVMAGQGRGDGEAMARRWRGDGEVMARLACLFKELRSCRMSCTRDETACTKPAPSSPHRMPRIANA